MVGSNDKTKENGSALKNYHGLSSQVIKNIHNMEINPKSIRHLYVIAIICCVHQHRNTCIQDGGHTQEVSHDNLNLPCWERDRLDKQRGHNYPFHKQSSNFIVKHLSFTLSKSSTRGQGGKYNVGKQEIMVVEKLHCTYLFFFKIPIFMNE